MALLLPLWRLLLGSESEVASIGEELAATGYDSMHVSRVVEIFVQSDGGITHIFDLTDLVASETTRVGICFLYDLFTPSMVGAGWWETWLRCAGGQYLKGVPRAQTN